VVQYEGKGEQHKIAIGKLLVQAKEACDAGGFTAFRERFCPNLGRSRAHELLLIASGKKTIEETKTPTRERVKKHRAAKKVAAPKASTPGSSVTVTDDPEVSAEKRKAEYADPAKINGSAAPEARPAVGEPEADREPSAKALAKNSGQSLTAKEKAARQSAHNLAEFTAACHAYLPKITIEADRQKAWLLVSELTGVKPKMKAA
jgi:hypothetical protein